MRFASSLSRLRPLLDLVFPPRCIHCGRLGDYLCETCREEAQSVGSDICIRCGNPLTTRGICHRCRQDPPDPIRAIRGVFFYNGPIAQSIRGLKYHGLRGLAPILADYLIAYIQAHPIPIDALVPVPLHPERLAQRGFNQSELLAARIALTLNIPLRVNLLRRIRPTLPQAQLNRKQRLQNVAGAFAPHDGVSLHGETILIIDDVATTGATLRACARPLRAMGAGDIWALTVARANMNVALDAPTSPSSPAEAFLLWDANRKQLIPDPTESLI